MDNSTVRKIDFYGGLHGNFLELAVNCWIDQNSYDVNQSQFTEIGTCHVKNQPNSNYIPVTKCNHYSYFGVPFDQGDLVIRIVPEESDLLIAISNSFLRAGDQPLDLEYLEIDTYKKMSALPKLQEFLDNLVTHHGYLNAYPRRVLRKYFYAMFDEYEHGLKLFTDWLPCGQFHEFKFRCFFDTSNFLVALRGIANFVNMDCVVDHKLVEFHKKFIENNQGYHSEVKCKKILDAILQQDSVPLHLNIIEEAYLNYKISRIFNMYDVDLLEDNQYPCDTATLSRILF